MPVNHENAVTAPVARLPMEPKCRTIKFYIREGQLPAAGTTSRTQARYTAAHLRRLGPISILQAELGMSVEKIGEVSREAGRGGEAKGGTSRDPACLADCPPDG